MSNQILSQSGIDKVKEFIKEKRGGEEMRKVEVIDMNESDFNEAAQRVSDWLLTNGDPHQQVIITQNYIKVTKDVVGFPNKNTTAENSDVFEVMTPTKLRKKLSEIKTQ